MRKGNEKKDKQRKSKMTRIQRKDRNNDKID